MTEQTFHWCQFCRFDVGDNDIECCQFSGCPLRHKPNDHQRRDEPHEHHPIPPAYLGLVGLSHPLVLPGAAHFLNPSLRCIASI